MNPSETPPEWRVEHTVPPREAVVQLIPGAFALLANLIAVRCPVISGRAAAEASSWACIAPQPLLKLVRVRAAKGKDQP